MRVNYKGMDKDFEYRIAEINYDRQEKMYLNYKGNLKPLWDTAN